MKSGGPVIYRLMVLLIAAVAAAGWVVFDQIRDRSGALEKSATSPPAPVEVAEIRRGPIVLRQTFSGELKAVAEFVVAPKVGGRIERIMVNLSDSVTRGQVVAELDNDEYVQAVAQAQADLMVAKANLSEAESALIISDREFKRTESLLKRGIASDSELDAASLNNLAKKAQFKVAEALVIKAGSSLETANIRLGYTRVTAGWAGGGEHRVVAERYVDEGQTVAANSPLLLVVELHPIVGIFFVTEKDYTRLSPGQSVSIMTDAHPGERYTGRIDRIAPVFHKSSRQARVEIAIDNPAYRLKPGMFIRAEVVLAEALDAIIIPEEALAVRNERRGVFVVSEDGRSVVWREVQVGIHEDGRVQVIGEGLSGRVVSLGQQLITDGVAITIPAEHQKSNAR